MLELKQLIQQYPELGEVFADFETRLLTLENSLSSPVGETPQKNETPEPEWTRRQWDAVTQLKGLVLHIQSKLNEHLDKSKPKKKPIRHKGIEL